MEKTGPILAVVVACSFAVQCSQDPLQTKGFGPARSNAVVSPPTSLALTAFRKMELECKVSAWRLCQKTGLFTYGETSSADSIYYRCLLREDENGRPSLELSWVDQECTKDKTVTYDKLLTGRYDPEKNSVIIGGKAKESRKGRDGESINQCASAELVGKIKQAYDGIWADMEEKAKSQRLEIMSRGENCSKYLKATEKDVTEVGSITVPDNVELANSIAVDPNQQVNVDATGLVLQEIKSIGSTKNRTPEYTFWSSKRGRLSYEGPCSSQTNTVQVGNNTIRFNSLDEGLHSKCTLIVEDPSKNKTTLVLADFRVDLTPPTLEEVSAVPIGTETRLPFYKFSSSESGSISYNGSCFAQSKNVVRGVNVIKLESSSGKQESQSESPFKNGWYLDCTIEVTDPSGNKSQPLNISDFRIGGEEKLGPLKIGPTNNPRVEITFSLPGTLSSTGPCSLKTTSVQKGLQQIVFNELADGTYTNCTYTFTDSMGGTQTNEVEITIDKTPPELEEVFHISQTMLSGLTWQLRQSRGRRIHFWFRPDPPSQVWIDKYGVPSQYGGATSGNYKIDTVDVNLYFKASEAGQINLIGNNCGQNLILWSNARGQLGNIKSMEFESTAKKGLNGIFLMGKPITEDGIGFGCKITVTDLAGNVSDPLTLQNFDLIDLTQNSVDTQGNLPLKILPSALRFTSPQDKEPKFHFWSSHSGRISCSSDCSCNEIDVDRNAIGYCTDEVSTTMDPCVRPATNTARVIQFNALTDGSYSDCKVTLTANGDSFTYTIKPFTVPPPTYTPATE